MKTAKIPFVSLHGFYASGDLLLEPQTGHGEENQGINDQEKDVPPQVLYPRPLQEDIPAYIVKVPGGKDEGIELEYIRHTGNGEEKP